MVSYKALNTIPESAIPNHYYCIRDVDTREGTTVIKSAIPNPCYTIWNVDVF